MNARLNVFQLASEYRQLEALIDSEADIPEAELVDAWLRVEGDLNHKLENLGFAIKNRQAILAGKQEAIKAMEKQAIALEKELDRLGSLAISLLTATNHKKAGGQYLTLSLVANKERVEVEDGAVLPAEYMRTPEPKPVVPQPDKAKLYEDMKAGVLVDGVRLVPSVRLAIR